ncbi:triose-phosphate isomerase [Mycoplasmopsis verecunda]|uniref:Triosephosphate isomerase n=1 Tax=Mycoplasmopsis verecunda TaxID=171291 RepID=A0A1T4L753_9BACT|nr:triose-phosphate isomerase [Mycoplasmopsis verecunda]WPB54777.1 triose-phosphate isomerase [Mycoplasmopsis verecunda]SJZ50380.1 triosephosphate isomerase [Mycoplasmopsis verecunda]
MNKILIIGNWKMNITFSEAQDFINQISALYQKDKELFQSKISFGIASPFTNLSAFKNINIDNFVLVAQDVSANECGSFTGEISACMLKDLGVKYAIVGHNERRANHKESNMLINAKAKELIKQDIIPIICVGENLSEFELGITKEVIKQQVLECTKDLEVDKYVIAYEPVWATGTGKCATSCQAQDISEFIRSLVSRDCHILYGGSVTETNVVKLINKDDIDGFLIGKASLNPEQFYAILKEVALNER